MDEPANSIVGQLLPAGAVNGWALMDFGLR